MPERRPTIDLPTGVVPSTGADIKELAEGMTDTEMKAMVIQIFRAQNEIIRFVRDFRQVMDAMTNVGGISGAMMNRKLPPGLMDAIKK